ncbi:Hypothetical predicted protein [Mytilus galloprovincialis]|uniref:Uncharacterized protein n=1 Tax=Mytilus galloprovincialis TaxID=29158 RepID=A0A8B6H3L2_MYTGA|nr:Hypothetical predicted protein [Mytilus galloprovincialis]
MDLLNTTISGSREMENSKENAQATDVTTNYTPDPAQSNILTGIHQEKIHPNIANQAPISSGQQGDLPRSNINWNLYLQPLRYKIIQRRKLEDHCIACDFKEETLGNIGL